MKLEQRRARLLEDFDDLADALQGDTEWIYSTLRTVSSSATASDEITKTIRALRTYGKEATLLEGRVPVGQVYVMLPLNNPLYSLVLYCFGALLGGSEVLVRPSSITSDVVYRVADRYESLFARMPITMAQGSGAAFLARAASSEEVKTLLFTGSYDNLLGVESLFPQEKTLIYCGSGINPFVVAQDAFSGAAGAVRIVDLAIRSKLYNSGQDCLCAERFYVHDSLFDDFVGELKERVSRLRAGGFADEHADIVPLLGSLADRLMAVLAAGESTRVILKGEQYNDLITPSIVEVPIDSTLLAVEKFGPAFVLARYRSSAELDAALDFNYRFGATICGSYWSSVVDTYPHVTASASVLEVEAEDAHVPFGGRLRSGFVRRHGAVYDGPILYSIETTTNLDATRVLQERP